MGIDHGGFNPFSAIYEKIGCGLAMANKWSDPPSQIILSFVLGVPAIVYAHWAVGYYVSLAAAPLVTVALYLYYHYVFLIMMMMSS